jgi:hypothetical protein
MERALEDILPPKARDKLTLLSDAVSESSVLIASHIRRVNELRTSMGNTYAQGKNSAASSRELARMLSKQTAQQVRFRESNQLLAQLQHWLQSLPRNVVLEDVKHPKPKIKGSAIEAVEAIRERIKATRKEIVAVQTAGPTLEDTKTAARAYVKAAAERARPKITATHDKFEVTFGVLDFSHRAITPFEQLCWLHPNDVIAKLDAEIDALPASPLALSAADKAARLDELSAALLALERDEEASIASSAQEIARRPQADPRAVLGVALVTAKPKAADAAKVTEAVA